MTARNMSSDWDTQNPDDEPPEILDDEEEEALGELGMSVKNPEELLAAVDDDENDLLAADGKDKGIALRGIDGLDGVERDDDVSDMLIDEEEDLD